jgi:hypothetical protein
MTAATEQAGARRLGRHRLGDAVAGPVQERIVARSGEELFSSFVLFQRVFGPVGSQFTLLPNSVSAAESEATEVAASGATTPELAKLLPV